MSFIETSIEVAGRGREIFDIIKDMERFPEFMPDIKSVKVLEHIPGGTMTAWESEIDGMPISWTEEDLFDEQNLRIDYRMTEGDLAKFEGRWSVTETPGGCEVRLTVDFDLGIPMLADVLGPVMEQKVRDNSLMMLNSIKRRIEEA